jgi:hypothetical protein
MNSIEAQLNLTFPHTYVCEQAVEILPSESSSRYYYPGASRQGGRDGILVRVQPQQGPPWVGTFAFGQIAPKGASGIFTMPAPDRLCVVSRGEGYIVSTQTPETWEPVRATPIIDVRSILPKGIIIFAEFTRLVAYDHTGHRWSTKRLSWDNLTITEVTDGFVRGEFWDIRSEKTESFIVDLATGTHQGGIKES